MNPGERVYREFSDADLVKLIGTGDHTAFIEIYEVNDTFVHWFLS